MMTKTITSENDHLLGRTLVFLILGNSSLRSVVFVGKAGYGQLSYSGTNCGRY
jgi:hypothetical protein